MTKLGGLGVQLGILFVLQLNNPTSPGNNEKVGPLQLYSLGRFPAGLLTQPSSQPAGLSRLGVRATILCFWADSCRRVCSLCPTEGKLCLELLVLSLKLHFEG